MKVTTLRLPPDLRAALEKEAARAGLSLSELIRAKLTQSRSRDDHIMEYLGMMLRECIVSRKLTARTLFGQLDAQNGVEKDAFRALMQRFSDEAQAIVEKMRG
jgi:hypothetical protein